MSPVGPPLGAEFPGGYAAGAPASPGPPPAALLGGYAADAPPSPRRRNVSADLRAATLKLAAAAMTADGVAPLSEAFLLALTGERAGTTHLGIGAPDGPLLAYAQVDPTGATELLVHPAHRRRRLGTALWAAALDHGAATIWAHGDLRPARAAATAWGLARVRELHRMARPLTPADATLLPFPAGFAPRSFRPGVDDQAWVSLNAAAFAHHREQGRLTLADLHERLAQPWFDPAGFFLIIDEAHRELGPIAFHWTKREAGPDGSVAAGEVYAVGVHPAYQGRGLGRPLTRLGTAHLAGRGDHRVELYVDGDNAAALATYRREGFVSVDIDAMYAVHLPFTS